MPCNATELVHFRKRTGVKGFNLIFDVAPVKNALYLEECGACHFAYQPGLLPSRSWKKMLSQQEAKNHFEEDITFDDKTVEAQLMHYSSSSS
jgi:hypothetical protein